MIRCIMRCLVAISLLGLVACGGGSSGPGSTPVPTPAVPAILSFTASRTSLTEGSATVLKWTVQDADRLTLDQGVGDVTGKTSLIAVPSQSVTYTLTAANAKGSSVAKVSVQVGQASTKPILSVVTPSSGGVVAGGSMQLTWMAAYATSVRLDPGGLDLTTTNKVTFTPSQSGTYTLTASNSRGTTTESFPVEVLPAGSKPAIRGLEAQPSRVAGGSTATVTWKVVGADSVRLEPLGDVTANQACHVAPISTTSYRLVAINAQGSVEQVCTVSVDALGQSVRTDHQQLLEDLREVASAKNEGRLVGSAGSARARAFLKARFETLALTPLKGGFEQPWELAGYRGSNVVGMIQGSTKPNEIIVVCGHYDHIGMTLLGLPVVGADDNASGTCGVLQLAAYFKAHPPARTLVFALFDGEEMGLYGSQAFVETPPVPLEQIKLVVNLDMISRADYGKLGVIGTSTHTGIRPYIQQAAQPWGLPVAFGFENLMPYSDQYNFAKKGIPTVFFCCVDHPDYHTPRDTYERISPDYFWKAVETAAGTVVAVDALPAVPARDPEVLPERGPGAFWFSRPALMPRPEGMPQVACFE